MNLRKEKGITLIALVITIIVMLILVGVTITMAVNGGLFGYAKNAAQRTNQAILDEQNLADLPGGWTFDNLIEKYTTDTQTTQINDPATLSNGTEIRDLSDYIGMTWLQWATDSNNTEPFYVSAGDNDVDLRDAITSSYANDPDNVIQYSWSKNGFAKSFFVSDGPMNYCAPTDMIRAGASYIIERMTW